ncbi:MAG: 3-hydroxyacyl-CoA dehydrogenase NAD-binding domain-containing protein [Burkholderiales bacterium]
MAKLLEKNQVAVIGAGTMGADITALFAAHGYTVHMVARPGNSYDTLPARAAVSAGQLGADGKTLRINMATELDSLPWQDIGLTIECLREDLPLKQRLFAEMERQAPADTVLASNSSGYPISEIGKGLATQSRMLGLHFFMPAHLVPCVEVVLSEHTDPAIARRVYDLMAALGSEPVWVKRDIPGFLANRLQHALMREVWSLIDRGIASPEDVDKVVRYGFGFRYVAAGPVLQKELSGLDVNCAASAIVYPDLCNDAGPPPVLTDKVARGELGIKTGKGFWTWSPQEVTEEKARYAEDLKATLKILEKRRKGNG